MASPPSVTVQLRDVSAAGVRASAQPLALTLSLALTLALTLTLSLALTLALSCTHTCANTPRAYGTRPHRPTFHIHAVLLRSCWATDDCLLTTDDVYCPLAQLPAPTALCPRC